MRDKQNINEEMNLRRQMITLINKKFHPKKVYSKKDKEKYNALGEESIIQTSELKKDIHDLVEDENS